MKRASSPFITPQKRHFMESPDLIANRGVSRCPLGLTVSVQPGDLPGLIGLTFPTMSARGWSVIAENNGKTRIPERFEHRLIACASPTQPVDHLLGVVVGRVEAE